MEKLRQAIRNLEAQAEKYERHLGAERFPSPGDAFFEGLTDDVNDVIELLELPKAKPVKSIEPAKPEESAKPEEPAKPAAPAKDKAAPKS